tara:strand:- start:2837 stop:3349 length:513 start_codon:yes stop_codon:yes gene_type:complete
MRRTSLTLSLLLLFAGGVDSKVKWQDWYLHDFSCVPKTKTYCTSQRHEIMSGKTPDCFKPVKQSSLPFSFKAISENEYSMSTDWLKPVAYVSLPPNVVFKILPPEKDSLPYFVQLLSDNVQTREGSNSRGDNLYLTGTFGVPSPYVLTLYTTYQDINLNTVIYNAVCTSR